MVGTLSQRFRELRRPPRNRLFKSPEATTITETKLLKPLQTATLLTKVSIPPGEDDKSFKRNNLALITECRKSKPSLSSLQSLLATTFPFRRNEILAGKDYSCILQDYPYLMTFDLVSILIFGKNFLFKIVMC